LLDRGRDAIKAAVADYKKKRSVEEKKVA